MTEKRKTCFKCGENKPLSDFYKHPRMADGHVNKCKECNKLDVQLNYRDNFDYYKEYDRQRDSEKGTDRHKMRLEYSRRKDVQVKRSRYANLPEVKQRKKELIERRNKEFPERKIANSAVSNAIRGGKLKRPSNCEYCGKECKPHAHHSSYADDMQLMVTWLCTSCHGEVHRKYE